MKLRFRVANVSAAVEGDWLGELVDDYRAYPADDGPPDLVIHIQLDRDFVPNRDSAEEYPAFERRALSDERIAVSRADAEGVVTVPKARDAPVVANFRVRGIRGVADAAVRVGLSLALPRRSGLVLHGSCVAFGDGALAFAGPSGAGKSTIAALLTDGGQRLALADELLVVSATAGQWTAYAAPFRTTGTIAHGTARPLRGVYFVQHGSAQRATMLSPTDSFRRLLRNVLSYATSESSAGHVMDVARNLVERVPCYELAFIPSADVMEVLEIT